MRLPWKRREVRASQPFTDAIVSAIAEQAGGTAAGDPGAIAALETAAGLWARAFAAVKVEPATPAVTPHVLALIARDLIRRGESVFAIEIEAGMVALRPVGSWDVRGPWREADWWYRVDLFGPSGNITRFVPSDAVVHCRYAIDPARPWLGLGPLQWARHGAAMAANAELRLSQEASGKVARVLPLPKDGEGNDNLITDLKGATGRLHFVSTTQDGYGEGRQAAPQKDWVQNRIGPAPDEQFRMLRTDAALEVLNACGVPVSLATDADGTSQREAWRRFVMGAVEPVGGMVARELGRKLDVPDLSFSFEGLWAHDLAGRAASFKAMVTAGMDMERAVALSGLAGADDE